VGGRYCSRACQQRAYRERKKESSAEIVLLRPAVGAYSPERRAPEFSGGNTASILHGAFSRSQVQQRVGELRSFYLEALPHLDATRDGLKLETLLEAAARHSLLSDFAWKVTFGEVESRRRGGGPRTGPEAVPVYIWEQITKLEVRMDRALSDLGMDVTGYSKAAASTAYGRALAAEAAQERLSKLIGQGRAIRAAQGRDLEDES
jgi:hypothetical protein